MPRRSLHRHLRRLFFVLSALGGVTSEPRLARASEPQEQQLAQALFDEARRLMDKKRYPEACPKLAESQRLDPGGGTLLNLAVCHEKEGKLATAKVDYEEALAVAVRDGRKDRQQIARERIAALEPVVPRISVAVPTASDTEGLEVKLDGLVLRRAAWGVSTPVDPGAHVIEVTAPSRTAWTKSIVVEPAQKKDVEVPALVRLAPLPLGALSSPPSLPPAAPVDLVQRPVIVEGGPGLAPDPDQVPPPYAAGELAAPKHGNPVFYTALAVTLAGAGTSLVTGVLALSAKSDAKSAGCLPDRKYCPDQPAWDTADRANTLAWVSTVSLGLAVAGAITMLVAPSRVSSKQPAFRAGALAGGAAFDLAGTF